MEFLSSQESLEKLVEECPPQKYEGLKKLLSGAGYLSVALGVLFGGYKLSDHISLSSNNLADILNGIAFKGVGFLIIGGASLVPAFFGRDRLVDGLTTLINYPVKEHEIYHRNGGFTSEPNMFDIRFGKKVIPYEKKYLTELSLANGLLIKGGSFKRCLCGYKAELDCEIEGDYIQLAYCSKNKEKVKSICKAPDYYCALIDSRFRIIDFWPAFKKL